MAKIKIDKERCKGCYLCVVNCPKGLIKISSTINKRGVKPVEFRGGKCAGCALCAVVCPDCGIVVLR